MHCTDHVEHWVFKAYVLDSMTFSSGLETFQSFPITGCRVGEKPSGSMPVLSLQEWLLKSHALSFSRIQARHYEWIHLGRLGREHALRLLPLAMVHFAHDLLDL